MRAFGRGLPQNLPEDDLAFYGGVSAAPANPRGVSTLSTSGTPLSHIADRRIAAKL
jgi:hypothetical protein